MRNDTEQHRYNKSRLIELYSCSVIFAVVVGSRHTRAQSPVAVSAIGEFARDGKLSREPAQRFVIDLRQRMLYGLSALEWSKRLDTRLFIRQIRHFRPCPSAPNLIEIELLQLAPLHLTSTY